tara:strand:+ start:214 stop:426 length:213 start_codon:yes stop_codon:yes gene_type:complete
MVKKYIYIPGSIIHTNDLIPWFTEDQSTLPAAYVASCQKFFNELQARNDKLQAASRVGPPNNVQGHKEKK